MNTQEELEFLKQKWVGKPESLKGSKEWFERNFDRLKYIRLLKGLKFDKKKEKKSSILEQAKLIFES